MRIFNNLENLKETLENSSITQTAIGYDMTKEKGLFSVTIKNDWENLPKGIFLIRHWKGSPKGYNGYFKGGKFLKAYVITKIIFYDDNEIVFISNYNEVISIDYNDLHSGNDYDVILKKLGR